MQIHLDLGPFGAQRVASERLAQFGHRAQIAGMQFLHFNRFSALHDGEMREPLLPAPGVIFDRSVRLGRRR